VQAENRPHKSLSFVQIAHNATNRLCTSTLAAPCRLHSSPWVGRRAMGLSVIR
jgi:hypothetical protein